MSRFATMPHPLDEFMKERTNQAITRCVVCGGEGDALVVLTIQKAENGRQIFGPKSSRSKRFAMCAEHAIAMFDRTTTEGL